MNLNTPPFTSRMLVLPTGQVLVTMGNSTTLYIYNPDGTPQDAWRPRSAHRQQRLGTYT
jgi:hypothetical protein